ncbi:MAG: pyridoxal 5'-phosphate synthase glutaminase subunit PdxT [Lachnospiraceae bacterium]|nr:pyridoxal 5'-phosphate synthase glutaminase subunit PdxT [Lachnospiraceae bacterium]
MKIGILALQGAFAEHGRMLDKLNIEHFEIRNSMDLDKNFDGLIIPGGESTVMGKLLRDLDMYENLKIKVKSGLPVFGTCAGLLLLAREVCGETPLGLQTMDIKVKRNAYGRQLGSFYVEEEFSGVGKIPMTFIRAPYIYDISENVECLARVDGKIVAARQGRQLVTAFHPELSDDLRVHEYFINDIMCINAHYILHKNSANSASSIED